MSNVGFKEGREISVLLRRLTFADNFESWECEVTLPANTEVAIANQFRSGRIPTSYLILSHEGNGDVRRGTTVWSEDFVYLRNPDAVNSCTVKVCFFR